MNTIMTALLVRVLAWLSGLTKKDFKSAIAFANEAQATFSVPDSATKEERDAARARKRQYVIDRLREILPAVGEWVLGLLVENAVAYIKKSIQS